MDEGYSGNEKILMLHYMKKNKQKYHPPYENNNMVCEPCQKVIVLKIPQIH